MDDAYYHRALAAAYVRGALPEAAALDDDALWPAAGEAGLRLHRFKRSAMLPRVRRVLGVLHGYAVDSLLDIGSGRGVFLWPLLDQLPGVRVTALDVDRTRVRDIDRVRRGGVARLSAVIGDVTRLAVGDRSVDAVTILEVLEHLERPELAAAEALRVARRAVVASVPSKEDDNPEHIRLYDRDSITALFREAGAARVQVEYVLNHIVAVASRE